MALIVAVQLPVMMTAIALLMGRAERQDGVSAGHANATAMAKAVGRNLLGNPIIIGLFAGLLWRLSGLPLAGLPGTLVDRLADVASTLALFAMGMSLRKYGIRGNIGAGLVLTILKLVIMPALVIVLVG